MARQDLVTTRRRSKTRDRASRPWSRDADARPRRTSREAAPVERTQRARGDGYYEEPRRRHTPEAEPERRTRSTRATKTSTRTKRVAKRAPRANRFEGTKPVRDKFTQTGLIAYISERAEVDKRDVKAVLHHLSIAMVSSICPRGPGAFTLGGLLRIKTRQKPATKGGKKAVSPFTGEEYVTKDKPARTIIRILPSKDLKEMAQRHRG